MTTIRERIAATFHNGHLRSRWYVGSREHIDELTELVESTLSEREKEMERLRRALRDCCDFAHSIEQERDGAIKAGQLMKAPGYENWESAYEGRWEEYEDAISSIPETAPGETKREE